MSLKRIFAGALILTAFSPILRAQTQGAQPVPAQAANKKSTAPSQQPRDPRERVFVQNCSRCHEAPSGFSSHISGTVVMHMRVRASLSQHDAEELLRFLNP